MLFVSVLPSSIVFQPLDTLSHLSTTERRGICELSENLNEEHTEFCAICWLLLKERYGILSVMF